jgi:hypothetical protein
MAGRRTQITIETERLLVIARQHTIRAWCEKCGSEVEFLAQDKSRSLPPSVPEQLEAEYAAKLHLGRAKDGLVICLKSLLRLIESAGT